MANFEISSSTMKHKPPVYEEGIFFYVLCVYRLSRSLMNPWKKNAVLISEKEQMQHIIIQPQDKTDKE